jgi:predicted deacylase/predicted small lipoprotein YifL
VGPAVTRMWVSSRWILCLAVVFTLAGCGQAGVSAPIEQTSEATVSSVPTPTARATGTATLAPAETPTPSPQGCQLLGKSWEGRSIVAYRFGTGPRKVVLVGDIHGGTEENTHQLALEMIAYFQEHVDEVPPEVTLWIIPTANPDGLANDTRRNAHMVDLNRNADTNRDSCSENDWAEDTYTTEKIIEGGGGPYPFSEVETRLLRDFLQDAEVAVFYHSMAGQIFVTSCADHAPSERLARWLSGATGYPFSEEGWTSYPVTGAIVDYLAYQGVAAVEVELTTKVDTEFERNLAGVRAVLQSLDEIASSP